MSILALIRVEQREADQRAEEAAARAARRPKGRGR